jgi:hypothetical protein
MLIISTVVEKVNNVGLVLDGKKGLMGQAFAWSFSWSPSPVMSPFLKQGSQMSTSGHFGPVAIRALQTGGSGLE